MGLGDVWNKFKEKQAAKKAEEEKAKQETEELRREVLQEMRPEIKEIMKQQIRQEELEKAKIAVQPKNKMAGLQKLADEFKGANLGTNEQMGKLLGNNRGPAAGPQRGTSEPLSNDKISSLMSSRETVQGKDYGKLMGGGSLRTQRDIPGELGSGHMFRKDYKDVVGGTPDKDYGKLVGVSNVSPEEKIKRLVGRK